MVDTGNRSEELVCQLVEECSVEGELHGKTNCMIVSDTTGNLLGEGGAQTGGNESMQLGHSTLQALAGGIGLGVPLH
jgi:hypothetical protein